MRPNTKMIGSYGEDAVEKYLKKRFWKIISRNYRARGGEIDIIGYRFGILVYFEVKTRSNDKFGAPADAVDDGKVIKIKSAAREFESAYMPFGYLNTETATGRTKKLNVIKKRIDVAEVFLNNGEITKIILRKDWEKTE